MFRNRLWWDDVSGHGQANDLLRAAQAQLRTPDLFERVASDLVAFRSAVDTKVLEQTRAAQEDLAQSQARFQRLIELVGGGYAGATLAIALLAGTADASLLEASLWTAIGALVGLVTVSGGGAILRKLTGSRS